jgi:HK97 family phage major capsid protein
MDVRVTEGLKRKLTEMELIDKDADDEAVKTAATDAIMNETLSISEFKSLSKDGDGENGSKLTSLLEQLVKNQGGDVTPDDKASPAKLPTWDDGSLTKIMSRFGTDVGDAEQRSGFYCDVKRVKDMYSTSKTDMRFAEKTNSGHDHPYAGQKAFEFTDAGKRFIEGASELDKAVSGAYLKLQANMQCKNVPRAFRMTDHDKALLNYALHEMKWGGVIGGECQTETGTVPVKNRKLTGMEIKTVIDDVATGGLEIAPIVFDDQVITIPILFGELAPFVNMVPVTRGRRIESATLGNMSLTSAGSVVDDTAIPLFATAGFIAAFDTTIHVVHGAIEIGLDLMSDSPIDIAGHVTQKYGELLLAWLDEQIAIGDGVVEPEGIMVASGTTAVTFGGAAPTIGGYESQLFGVPKRYKQGFDRSRLRFAANETTYSRARGIPVGAADARRLYGMNEENYMIFDHGFSIVDTMANTQGFFANLARYRMYRRLGMSMNMTTEGRELTLRNKMLITARARYGGRLEDGLAAAVTTDHQA